MMRQVIRLTLTAWCGALMLGSSPSPLQSQSYHVARTIPLVGDAGWDYLTFDSTARRVFIAHSTQVLVVDADSGTLLGQIPGLNGAHGVALAYPAGHGFASSGRDSGLSRDLVQSGSEERKDGTAGLDSGGLDQ